ncbi:MAG TPA: ComF family protein [Chthoniobacterales bacterium]
MSRVRPQPWLKAAIEVALPAHCVSCGNAARRGAAFCRDCRRRLPRIRGARCEVCSEPFSAADEGLVCTNCRGRNFYFVATIASYRANGEIRELIHRLKYNRELHLRRPLGWLLRRNLLDDRLRGVKFDGLVPVPLHPLREREREFNQSRLLAEELAQRAKVPVWDDLKRIRATETQTHFDRHERMQNLRGAFVLRRMDRVPGQTLALIDDVFTTGSTLNECARVLLEAGARTVWALTVARA